MPMKKLLLFIAIGLGAMSSGCIYYADDDPYYYDGYGYYYDANGNAVYYYY